MSCDWVSQSIDETNHPVDEASKTTVGSEQNKDADKASTKTEEEETISFFADSIKLVEIQKKLLNLPKFQGKNVLFYRDIYFYDFKGGDVSLKIQDPDKPENLDTYTYQDGKWKAPQPVNTSGNNTWDKDLLNLNKLDFSAVKKINDIIEEKKRTIEGAKEVNHIYYSNSREDYEWRAYIRGSRKNYTLTFKRNGDLNTFKMD
ncbi:MAG: hypothetical protein ACRDE7_14935 [Sphingobacterium sp.]